MTLTEERPRTQQHVFTTAGHALPQDPRSAALARTIVGEKLRGFAPTTVETTQALVSELVANAVLHACSMLVLHITVTEDRLQVGVEDLSFDYPLPQEPSPESDNGWGLVILDALATAWGWHRTPVGKQVWFELPACS
jgi:anti-sigma regulatory factor (Ser/Thr protein kinase)